MDELADPGLIAGGAAEAELVPQDVLELAVLQAGQARIAEPDLFVERAARVGPVALEPPGLRPCVQGAEPVERGEPPPPVGGGVGELPAPERPGLSRGHRAIEGGLGRRMPRGAELLGEARPLRELLRVGMGVGGEERT